MRATFLRTGGAAPTTMHASSVPPINCGGERPLFDCGEDTQRQMMRYGIGFGVSHLFVTHLHGDHILGIPGLIQTFDLNDRDGSLATHGPPGSKGHLEQLVHASGHQPGFHASVHEVRPGSVAYRADDYEVHAFDTEYRTVSVGHTLVEDDRPGRFDREKVEELGVPVNPTFGHLHTGEDVEFEDGTVVRSEQVVGDPRSGRTIVYTGDIRSLNSTVEVACDADLLVHNVTLIDEEAEWAEQTVYSTAWGVVHVARDADVWRFTLVHISARYAVDLSPPLEQAREVYDGGAFVAEDGRKLEVPYVDSGDGGAGTGEQPGGRGTGMLFPCPCAPVDVPQDTSHIVDAFAAAKYAGNQFAVSEDADALHSGQMVVLANETNYSETTFIEGGLPDDGYDIRILTPDGEIPFVGHLMLGTVAALRDHFGAGDEVTLNLGVGPISVEVRGDGSDSEQHWTTQNASRFGAEFDRETLAEVLSFDANDFDVDWSIQAVLTDLPVVMILLHDRDVLVRSGVLIPAYRPFFDDVGAENLFPFCPDPCDDASDFVARMYVLGHGATEDPATGGANGCSTDYLTRHRYFGDDEIEVTVERGYEMGRSSQLHLEVEDRDDEVVARIGGRVEFVPTGRLV